MEARALEADAADHGVAGDEVATGQDHSILSQAQPSFQLPRVPRLWPRREISEGSEGLQKPAGLLHQALDLARGRAELLHEVCHKPQAVVCMYKSGVLFVGTLTTRALLFGFYIGAPDFWKLL